MFTTVTKYENEKTTHTYPCGCAEIETFHEGSMGPYGTQHSFKSCGDHQHPLPSFEHATRIIASELNLLSKRESLDGTPATLWEALVSAMNTASFRNTFSAEVKHINMRLQHEEEEKIKRIKLNQDADKYLLEAEQLFKEYKDLIAKVKKEGRPNCPTYDQFVASMKKINDTLNNE